MAVSTDWPVGKRRRRRLDGLALVLVVDQHDAPILALVGRREGVVVRPEHVQQGLIVEDCGVVLDLDDLGVVTQRVVARLGLGPARVADARTRFPEPGASIARAHNVTP